MMIIYLNTHLLLVDHIPKSSSITAPFIIIDSFILNPRRSIEAHALIELTEVLIISLSQNELLFLTLNQGHH